jgi:hypothetical protein
MKFVCFTAVFCAVLLFAFNASAQSSGAAEPYKIVEIEKFAVAEGVQFPDNDLNELMGHLVLNFNNSRRFENVFLSTDSASQTAPVRRARVSGTITKYSKGSRAARYLVGFGAGRTKLVASVKVTDAESGSVLLEQNVDGHVYGGLFGGSTDAAKGNMSSEIIKSMTKKGYASKVRLKK